MGMKFDTYNRAQSSDFASMLTGKVQRHFENAFRIKFINKTVTRMENGKEKQSVEAVPVYDIASRQWVRDVIEIFARRMDITEGQAIQAFKTGNINALQRVFGRRAEKNPVKGDKYAADMTALEYNHFADHVRNAWSFALSLRHPGDSVPRESSSTISTAVGEKPVVNKNPDFKGKAFVAA